MAELSDPVLQAVSQTVRHALTHIEIVQRDAERLSKKNGCCSPTTEATGLPCCGPAVIALSASR